MVGTETAKQFATPAQAWPRTLNVNWRSCMFKHCYLLIHFIKLNQANYQTHFFIEFWESAETPEEAPHEVDGGSEVHSPSEPLNRKSKEEFPHRVYYSYSFYSHQVVIDERHQETAGNANIQ